MKKETYLKFERFVLRRLLDEHCFGQKQMLLENVAKYAQQDKGLVERVIVKMIANGLLLAKKKHYGVHVWINPGRMEEVRRIVLEDAPPQ